MYMRVIKMSKGARTLPACTFCNAATIKPVLHNYVFCALQLVKDIKEKEFLFAGYNEPSVYFQLGLFLSLG